MNDDFSSPTDHESFRVGSSSTVLEIFFNGCLKGSCSIRNPRENVTEPLKSHVQSCTYATRDWEKKPMSLSSHETPIFGDETRSARYDHVPSPIRCPQNIPRAVLRETLQVQPATAPGRFARPVALSVSIRRRTIAFGASTIEILTDRDLNAYCSRRIRERGMSEQMKLLELGKEQEMQECRGRGGMDREISRRSFHDFEGESRGMPR